MSLVKLRWLHLALLRCVLLHLHGNLENVGVGVVLVASQGRAMSGPSRKES